MRKFSHSYSLRRAVVLSGFLFSLVAATAHGNDHGSMEVDIDHGMETAVAAIATPGPFADDPNSVLSYFAYRKATGTIIAHIAFMVIAWVIVLPVGVFLSVAKSRLALPAQFLFLGVNSLGLLLGAIYNSQAPDLYENNAHHKIGWIATWVMVAQVIMGLLSAYSKRKENHTEGVSYERVAFLPTDGPGSTYARDVSHEYRWSGDSGQGTERNSCSLRGSSLDHSHSHSLSPTEVPEEFETPTKEMPKRTCDGLFSRFTFIDNYLTPRIPGLLSRPVIGTINVIYTFIERTILVFGFVALATGGVVYGGIFRDNNVFNGLAHFIKGGIFVWYGFLTLGRWVGSFADVGWAWNTKPSRAVVGAAKARVPTAEFVESFVIFLYGASNVFLEHLAAWGDAWTAQDLEHVSISVMFFGGGLCGMLAESKRVRDWVNLSALPQSVSDEKYYQKSGSWKPPKQHGVSLNPMPAIVIMLLGLMMSSHHQHSMVSTMVHKQWGMLLVGFSLARSVTYTLLYIRPPSSVLPSRPPSELVASFCLISGGFIFMLSTKDIVNAMEYYNLNAMFVFTIGMGVTALLMAWEISLISLKAWATKRSIPSQSLNQHSFHFPAEWDRNGTLVVNTNTP
ncbi:hypothetical protein FQN57_004497 [Myotisia sp. PD_48]|nr:hypothetical protein FQN57_004497 [Myotisia sp. PD_48]